MTPSSNSAAADTQFDLLDAPLEPLELKHRLRQRALEQPDMWHRSAGRSGHFADWLWDQWAPALSAWGIARSHFDGILHGFRQELWLWTMGERTWAHTADALAGRIRRRAPIGSDRPLD